MAVGLLSVLHSGLLLPQIVPRSNVRMELLDEFSISRYVTGSKTQDSVSLEQPLS